MTDLDWDSDKNCLVSCSVDQTTRLLMQVGSELNSPYYEVARPQVHGYDLNTIALLRNSSEDVRMPDRLLSGADEKVIRLFEAPYSFVKSANSLDARIKAG